MSTTITEQHPITFSDFPLEAYTEQATSVAQEITYSVGERMAVDSLLEIRHRVSAVLIKVPPFDNGRISVGRCDEDMDQLEGHCETNAQALKVWIALKRCRDFVQWRSEAESRIAGGVAA